MMTAEFDALLKGDLQNRLKMIIQEVPHFWDQSLYPHFTNHGPAHSERVHRQKLGQLAQELPENSRLTDDEIFIVSAAAWLYEIGMQSPYDFRADEPATIEKLNRIRSQRHQLTYQMIINSVRWDYSGPLLRLGLMRPADEYTRLIAEVCRWCSDEPLENVPEELPVSGVMVRVRLLVALLRLADQLYVDSQRVNLDLLQQANLPPRELARWWAYHYTQVLPIEKGRIRFHYYLPIVHKSLIGHIRALIEPDFQYAANPNIRYLWDEYALVLVPHSEPSVQFDQPSGFQHEMSRELIAFLRQQVTPIPTRLVDEPPTPAPAPGEDRYLMVLDYESFVLQLGREGHFLPLEEIGRQVVTLLREASNQYDGPVEGLAVGHWERPDLTDAARILEARVFGLITASPDGTCSEALTRELTERLQAGSTYRNVLLVAPDADMAAIVRRFTDRRQPLSAWIADLDETDIYRAVVRNVSSLSKVLALPERQRLSADQFEDTQAACILRLDGVQTAAEGMDWHITNAKLAEVEAVHGHTDWWRLFLLNQRILLPVRDADRFAVRLNGDHPAVVSTRACREATIQALQALTSDGRGVRQDQLVAGLERQATFQHNVGLVLRFLAVLKDENIVHLGARDPLPDGESVWILNRSHPAVAELNADRYLRLFVLALDHAMVQNGFLEVHEHTIERRAASYMGASVASLMYRFAQERGLVQREVSRVQPPDRDQRSIDVRLRVAQPDVREALINRDVILHELYQIGPDATIDRDAFTGTLKKLWRFTLNMDEISEWLAVFQRERLIDIQRDSSDSRRDKLSLNQASMLVQRLLTRQYAPSLTRSLRLSGAIQLEKAQPLGELFERLSRVVTRGNKQLAVWALEYARSIRLIEYIRKSGPNGPYDEVFLRRHPLVQELDIREQGARQAMLEIAAALEPRYRDRWVPLPVFTREADKDSRLGYTIGERDYWIDIAVHRHHILERRMERPQGRPIQNFIRRVMRPGDSR